MGPVGEIDTGLDLSGEISVAEQRALHSNQALLWEVEMTQILDSISQICAEEAAEEAGNIHFESNKDSINDEA